METLTHQKWSGAALVDAAVKTAAGGASSTLAMGAGVTEAQFRSSMDDPIRAEQLRKRQQLTSYSDPFDPLSR